MDNNNKNINEEEKKEQPGLFTRIYKFFAYLTYINAILSCIFIIIILVSNNIVHIEYLLFCIPILFPFFGELYLSNTIIESEDISKNMVYGITSGIITMPSGYAYAGLVYEFSMEIAIALFFIPFLAGFVQIILSFFVKTVKKNKERI